MRQLVIIGILTILTYNQLQAQEKQDSLTLFDGESKIVGLINFNNALNLFYPFSGQFVNQQQMLYQVFEYNAATANRFQYLVSPYNAFYYYSHNGFTFYQHSVPLFIGFSYHSNGAFGSKKMDLFVDGSGALYNDYWPTDPNVLPGDTKGFIWEMGVGVGYKMNAKSTLFIKGSVLMNNMNPYGARGIGGMNVKF